MRPLITSVALLSLLLCVAAVALWVRSYWYGDGVTYGFATPAARGKAISANTNRGMFYLVAYDESYAFPGARPAGFAEGGPSSVRRQSYKAYNLGSAPAGLLGFGYTDGTRTRTLPDPPGVLHTQRWRTLAFPLWVPSLLLALPPAAWVWRERRRRTLRRRVALNLCSSCGYDLRGNQSGVCPECGGASFSTGSKPPVAPGG